VVQVWDLTSGEVQGELRLQLQQVYELAFNASGKRLAVAGDGLLMWDPLREGSARWMTGGSLRRLCQDLRLLIGNAPSTVSSVAWSPDGRLLASTSEKSIEVWEVFSDRKLGKLKGHKNLVANLVFSSGGEQLISSDRRGGEILIWDLEGF
jgi:WD40 repeat protein